MSRWPAGGEPSQQRLTDRPETLVVHDVGRQSGDRLGQDWRQMRVDYSCQLVDMDADAEQYCIACGQPAQCLPLNAQKQAVTGVLRRDAGAPVGAPLPAGLEQVWIIDHRPVQ